MEPECLPDVRPHVLGLLLQHRQEGHQLHQLVVLLVHEPGLDGDPVLELVAKGLRGVVDDDGLAEVAAQDVKVLDVVAVDTDAVFPEESVLDPSALWVQEVHQLVSVHLGSQEVRSQELGARSQEGGGRS